MSDSSVGRAVVSAADVDPDEYAHGRRTFRQTRLGHAAGGEELGASLNELDPGHRTWPPHYHAANEEAIYVLDGELTLWLGSGEKRTEYALSPGDYVALPTGEAHAHEVEATSRDGTSRDGAGEETVRFLVFSTMEEPDFTVQPDHRKVLLIAGDPPGEYEGRYLSKTLDFDAEVDYWDDETAEDSNEPGERTETDGGTASAGAQVVAPDDLDWSEYDHGDRRFRRKQLGAAAGGEDLGTSLYEVPPGKRTWLPHYHTGNEEAIYVLAGEGTITTGVGREEHGLSPGTYVALPPGEAGYHDVEAGETTLRYLIVSTMNEPDVTVYPDDGKVGLYAGSAPGGDPDERTLSKYLDADAEVEYWE